MLRKHDICHVESWHKVRRRMPNARHYNAPFFPGIE